MHKKRDENNNFERLITRTGSRGVCCSAHNSVTMPPAITDVMLSISSMA